MANIARKTSTLQYRQSIDCHNCGATNNIEDGWKKWIRNNDNLNSQEHGIAIMDSDMWVHKFGTRKGLVRSWDRSVQYLMLVEVKTHGKDLTAAQRDTINAVDALLRTKPMKEYRDSGKLVAGHKDNVRKVLSKFSGKESRIICYGLHVLRMSHQTPGISDADPNGWITWDGKNITARQLEMLFRFDLDPDSLRTLEHREHKKQSDQQLLFGPEDVGMAV
jgi:hypothetical protein